MNRGETQQELSALPMGQLRAKLAARGLGFGRGEKKAELIERYMSLAMITQPNDLKPPAKKQQPEPKEVVWLTPQELREAMQPELAAGLEMRADDKVWEMRFGKRQDSGSMSLSLALIKRCAMMLMR